MGLATLHSRAQNGLAAPPVTVEVHLSGGLPRFSIVGLAEVAVREARDRVRGAILESDFAEDRKMELLRAKRLYRERRRELERSRELGLER